MFYATYGPPYASGNGQNFLASLLFKSITYVEAEVVEFLRFRFHRKRTASASISQANPYCCHLKRSTQLSATLTLWP